MELLCLSFAGCQPLRQGIGWRALDGINQRLDLIAGVNKRSAPVLTSNFHRE
jgi:hypothetical protein